MKMRKFVIVLALAGLLVGVGVASAQDGRPGGPRSGVRFAALQMLLESAMDSTGLERADLMGQIRDGSTLAEVITANGGDSAAVLADALAKATDAVNERIAAGELTQAQGDQLLARAEEGFQATLAGELNRPLQRLPRVRIARHVVQLAAEQTDLEAQAILEQLRDGSSLADILTANSVDPAAFIDDVMTDAEEAASNRLEQLRERLTDQINQANNEA